MFNYEVLTEDEAMKERYQLLSDGDYQGVIKKATCKTSYSGNNMLELEVDIYDENGKVHPIKDFLVFTKSMLWKVIHCTQSSGTFEQYEQKKLTPELLENKNIIASIRIQKGSEIPIERLNGKPEGSKYPDKNVVLDYIKKEGFEVKQKEEDIFDDDLAF